MKRLTEQEIGLPIAKICKFNIPKYQQKELAREASIPHSQRNTSNQRLNYYNRYSSLRSKLYCEFYSKFPMKFY
jgi:hypothetical protein